MSAQISKSISSLGKKANVSVLSVTPNRATRGDVVTIKGVGFTRLNILVKYVDAEHIDSSPVFVNSQTVKSTVPQLDQEGPVKMFISFDNGQRWNSFGGLTYQQAAQTTPQPKQPEPKPVSKAQASPQPTPVAKPQVQPPAPSLSPFPSPSPSPSPYSHAAAQSEVRSVPVGWVSPLPRAKTQVSPQPQPQPVATPEPKPEPTAELKPEPTPETKPEPEPKREAAERPEAVTIAKREVDSQVQGVYDKLFAANPQVNNIPDIDAKLATLVDGDKFRQFYFDRVPTAVTSNVNKIVDTMAPKVDSAVKENLSKLLLHQANPEQVEIKLHFSDISMDPTMGLSLETLFGPYSAWAAQVKAMRNSFVYVALQVGPYILNWDAYGLVVPRAAAYVDSLMYIDSPVIKVVYAESDISHTIKKLCGVCAEWNKEYTYDPHKRNSQHFVEELLSHLSEWRAPPTSTGLGAAFHLMRQEPQQFWIFPDTASDVNTTFKTHQELDTFCQERKNRLEKSDPLPDTALGTRPEFTLLKMIDRALWVRHLTAKKNITFSPVDEDSGGCFFENPAFPDVQQLLHKKK